MNLNNIIAYTDGACIGNGSKTAVGGWAFVLCFDNGAKEIHAAGYSEGTTNQRMELTAMIKVLEEIRNRWPDSDVEIAILSDSQYVVKGANDWMFRWEKNDWHRGKNKTAKVSNLDLWKKVFELVNETHPNIQWVKGHAGHEYNELCDSLAATAIDTQSDYYKAIRAPIGN